MKVRRSLPQICCGHCWRDTNATLYFGRRGIIAPKRLYGGETMGTLFVLAVGIVIGWNLPQPAWARDAQAKLIAMLRNIMKKT